MISPPPIIQMFLPACLRRRSAKALIDSLTNWTAAGNEAGAVAREHVVHVIRAEARAHLYAHVESLATQNLGID
jgi:hypothetical protein